jgi:hypothetical protein
MKDSAIRKLGGPKASAGTMSEIRSLCFARNNIAQNHKEHQG